MIKNRVKLVGDLPPFIKIADALYGKDADVDSDGNSKTAKSTNWNELTLILRNDTKQRLDIDPDELDKKYLFIRSEKKTLVTKTVDSIFQ